MANISLGQLGGGNYDEALFEQMIYDTGADNDWWIEENAWRRLLDGLRAFNLEINSSKEQFTEMINALDKDLPANPGVRFPGHRGSLGYSDYEPLRFRRIDSHLRAVFEELVQIAAGVRNNKGRRLIWSRNLSRVMGADPNSYYRAKFEKEFNLNWT